MTIELLELAASGLGELVEEVAFVGGATVALETYLRRLREGQEGGLVARCSEPAGLHARATRPEGVAMHAMIGIEH